MFNDNPTYLNQSPQKGAVEIVRVAPNNQCVEIEYVSAEEYNYVVKLHVYELESKKTIYEQWEYDISSFVFKVDKLLNGIKYVAEVSVMDKEGEELYHSNARIFETGLFPGKVVNYIHPEDYTFMESGMFIGSPNIIKLEDGVYIASHEIFTKINCGTETLCRFYRSHDFGKTWTFLSELDKCAFVMMFQKDGKLYALGNSTLKDSDLVLYESENEGASWSEPVAVIKHAPGTRVRSAPCPYTRCNGRLWFYVGVFSKNESGEDNKNESQDVIAHNVANTVTMKFAVASVDENSDVTNPDNWILSKATAFDETWEGVSKEWFIVMMEEGNVLVGPDGELKLISRQNSMRYGTPHTYPEKMKALVFGLDKNDPTAAPQFEEAIPLNGSLSKFYIKFDEVTKLYYCLLNRVTNGHKYQRNVLSLYSSPDLKNWSLERDLINLEDMQWYESDEYAAVQYPSFFIEDNDICAVLRTALNGAFNFHNANALTFHRFRNFRDFFKGY